MPPFIRSLILVIILTIISGCTIGIAPSSLNKPASPSTIVVEQDIVSIYDNGDVIVLAAGNYVAEYEDGEGIFYRGPGYAYSYKPAKPHIGGLKPLYQRQGGLYISKDSQSPRYRMYGYRDSGPPSEKSESTANTPAPTVGSDLGTQMVLSSPQPAQTAVGAAIGNAIAESLVNEMYAASKGNIGLERELSGNVVVKIRYQ